jgi:hypothetical protein
MSIGGAVGDERRGVGWRGFVLPGAGREGGGWGERCKAPQAHEGEGGGAGEGGRARADAMARTHSFTKESCRQAQEDGKMTMRVVRVCSVDVVGGLVPDVFSVSGSAPRTPCLPNEHWANQEFHYLKNVVPG